MERIKKFVFFRPNKLLIWGIISLALVVGIVLRFMAMRRGHNFDFQSYTIVRDIVLGGGNVYAETVRYNYGPVWFTLLGFFGWLAEVFKNPDLFRILIVTSLTLADIGIAFLLRKKYGLLAFLVFFLNPISIVITGYHNQFDNVALLAGLYGLLLLPDDSVQQLNRWHVYAALLIGLSLTIKHLFFVLPLWLFIWGKTLKIKLFMAAVPVAVFALSFMPFWWEGHGGIIQNVFLYKSYANAPLLNALFSEDIVQLIHPTLLLIVALGITGVLTRKLPKLEAGLWYLLVLVIFAPAIANQYLAIAMPAVAAVGTLFFLPFLFFAALLLVVTSRNGLHLGQFVDNIPIDILKYVSEGPGNGQYRLIILSLFIGAVITAITLYRPHCWTRGGQRAKRFVAEQAQTVKTKKDHR